MTPGSLWNFRDEMNNDPIEKVVNNYRINNSKTVTSKSFEHKTKRSTSVYNSTLSTEVVVTLKYLIEDLSISF